MDEPKYIRFNFKGKKIWGRAVLKDTELILNDGFFPEMNASFCFLPDESGIYLKLEERK